MADVPASIETDDRLLITVAEAARLLSVSTWSVYDLTNKGMLERRYIGKVRFRIPMDSLRAYVDSLEGFPPNL